MRTAKLFDIAADLRSILEHFSRSNPNDGMLGSFPLGCCGTTAHLVGRYLIEAGYTDALYFMGENIGGQTRAWIETRAMIVDITADQFGKPPIIVTADHGWHRQQWKLDELPCRPICRGGSHWPSYPVGAWLAIAGGMPDRGHFPPSLET